VCAGVTGNDANDGQETRRKGLERRSRMGGKEAVKAVALPTITIGDVERACERTGITRNTSRHFKWSLSLGTVKRKKPISAVQARNDDKLGEKAALRNQCQKGGGMGKGNIKTPEPGNVVWKAEVEEVGCIEEEKRRGGTFLKRVTKRMRRSFVGTSILRTRIRVWVPKHSTRKTNGKQIAKKKS